VVISGETGFLELHGLVLGEHSQGATHLQTQTVHLRRGEKAAWGKIRGEKGRLWKGGVGKKKRGV
jgi:hypothetical protein